MKKAGSITRSLHGNKEHEKINKSYNKEKYLNLKFTGSEAVNNLQKSELISREQEGKIFCLDAYCHKSFKYFSRLPSLRVKSSEEFEKV